MYPCLDFACCSCIEEKVALAYDVFKRDFIKTKLYLAQKIYILIHRFVKSKMAKKRFFGISLQEKIQ